MIKPAGTDGDIALGREPVGAGTVPAVQPARVGLAGGEVAAVERGPAGHARRAVFVAHPPDVRAAVAEHAGVGLEFADDLPGVGPVVIAVGVNRAPLPRPAVIA